LQGNNFEEIWESIGDLAIEQYEEDAFWYMADSWINNHIIRRLPNN
jgi:hypothetical protein